MTEGTSETLQVTRRHQTHPNYTWPCLMLLRGNAFQSQPEMQLCRWMGAVCSTTRPCHHSLGTQRAALRSWPTGSLRVPWPDSMWRRPFPSPLLMPCWLQSTFIEPHDRLHPTHRDAKARCIKLGNLLV